MPLDLDATQHQSENDITGGSRPAVGKYLVVLKSAEEGESRTQGLQGLSVEFEILGGTTPGQAGLTLPAWFSYEGEDEAKTKKALLRCERLALCLGLLQPGQKGAVDFQDGIGRLLVIEVVPNSFENKRGQKVETTQIGYLGFWSMGNPEVADVMAITEVQEAARSVLGALPQQQGQPQPAQQQPQQPPPQQQPAGGGNGQGQGQPAQQQPAPQQPQHPVAQPNAPTQPPVQPAQTMQQSKWSDL